MTSRFPTSLRPLSRRVLAGLFTALLLLGGIAPLHAETRSFNMWWAPECVTKGGHETDKLLMIIFWLTLAVFILTQTVYIIFLVKYRYRKGVKAVYSHGNNKLELIWTATPAAIFIILAAWSDRVWLQLRGPAPDGRLTLDLVAYQFGFHIRNPGTDGKLGAYNQGWIQKGDNNFGTDPTHDDPAGHDDYQSENQITLPVNKPVQFVLRSQDVIHAFYVPEFRMYQDIVPGMTIDWVWFTPEKEGHYALACNQLCGSGHYNMQAKIDVVSQADYDKLVTKMSDSALKSYEEKHKAANTVAALPSAPAIASAQP